MSEREAFDKWAEKFVWFGQRQKEDEWEIWQAAWSAALDEAAKAVTKHDVVGREWVPNSFWDIVSKECAGRVLALKD